MNIRQALTVCIALASLLIAPFAPAQSRGTFTELSPGVPVATGSRIEVIEFFYFGCPVCYELQPHLSRWLAQAPEYVALRRVPALSLGGAQSWERFARLYYTLEAVGHMPRLLWPVSRHCGAMPCSRKAQPSSTPTSTMPSTAATSSRSMTARPLIRYGKWTVAGHRR